MKRFGIGMYWDGTDEQLDLMWPKFKKYLKIRYKQTPSKWKCKLECMVIEKRGHPKID